MYNLIEDIKWAQEGANIRLGVRSLGGVDALGKGKDSFWSHFKGVLGELVYTSDFNLGPVRIEITPDRGDDFPAHGVNVRATQTRKRKTPTWCIGQHAKRVPSKRYGFVLLDITPHSVIKPEHIEAIWGRFIGWMTIPEVRDCHVDDPGNLNKPCWMPTMVDVMRSKEKP